MAQRSLQYLEHASAPLGTQTSAKRAKASQIHAAAPGHLPVDETPTHRSLTSHLACNLALARLDE